MKTKSGENKKKLVLNKISIAQLDKYKIQVIKGGLPLNKDVILGEIKMNNNTITTIFPPPICNKPTIPYC